MILEVSPKLDDLGFWDKSFSERAGELERTEEWEKEWRARRHHSKLVLCPCELIPWNFFLQGPAGRGGGMGGRGNTLMIICVRKAE